MLAVVVLVVAPLLLLLVGLGTPSVRRRMLVYWRTSALLGITVYLWIDQIQTGFLTGFLARALIPLALWRGDVLFQMRDQPLPSDAGLLGRWYRRWRAAAIAYCLAGLVYMLPVLPCAFGADAAAICQAWYAPPQQYAAWVHPDVSPLWLGRYGWVALGVYAAYLLASGTYFTRTSLERSRQDASDD
jgi:hypothetical protein